MQITYEFVIKYIGIKYDPPPLKTTKPRYAKNVILQLVLYDYKWHKLLKMT